MTLTALVKLKNNYKTNVNIFFYSYDVKAVIHIFKKVYSYSYHFQSILVINSKLAKPFPDHIAWYKIIKLKKCLKYLKTQNDFFYRNKENKAKENRWIKKNYALL